MKKAIFLYDYTGIMAKPWLDAGYECWCFDGQHPEGVTRNGNHVKVGMWFDAYTTSAHAIEITKLVGDGVKFVFGFPECTDMAVSGAAHFSNKAKNNIAFQAEAVELARLVMYIGRAIGCPWGLENPISVLSTIWKKPTFSFHPHEYGGYLPIDDIHPEYPDYIRPRDAYPKKTCIWSGNGFVEPARKRVGPDLSDLDDDGLCTRDNHYLLKTVPSVDHQGSLTGGTHEIRELAYPEYTIDGKPVWGYSDQHKKLGGKSLKTKNIRSATPRGFARAVFLANS